MLRNLLIALALLASTAHADFAIKDGDTVVFLGDSITAARTYGKIVENYTLLRFPDRNVHFVNSGWGGDTAAGGLKRIERDVFDKGATLVTVAYGINDIGWGGKADAEHRQIYLDGIRGIVAACKERKVRVFICSPAATAADPDKSADDFLQKMCDDGMKIARDAGEGSIDILREMRAIQRVMKKTDPKETLHAADGIHLNDTGQTAMAYAILKGLGAPRDVSTASIDAQAGKNLSSDNCTISNIKALGLQSASLEFDRLDSGLPFNQGLFFNLRYRFIPLPDEINRYLLTITNLKPGKYTIKANDRPLGVFTHDQLAKGINIASATNDGWEPGGPWDAQAWALNYLTESRNESAQVEKTARIYLETNPNKSDVIKQLAAINEHIESAQRAIAKPQTYHFVVAPEK